MKLTENQIGPYEVYRDRGNEVFMRELDSMWRSANPKGATRQGLCWAKANYLCHQLLLTGTYTKPCSRAIALCKALIYGWDRPVSDGLLLSPYWAEEYIGISHKDDGCEPITSSLFSNIQESFDQQIWEKMRSFILELSVAGEVEH